MAFQRNINHRIPPLCTRTGRRQAIVEHGPLDKMILRKELVINDTLPTMLGIKQRPIKILFEKSLRCLQLRRTAEAASRKRSIEAPNPTPKQQIAPHPRPFPPLNPPLPSGAQSGWARTKRDGRKGANRLQGPGEMGGRPSPYKLGRATLLQTDHR